MHLSVLLWRWMAGTMVCGQSFGLWKRERDRDEMETEAGRRRKMGKRRMRCTGRRSREREKGRAGRSMEDRK